MRTPNASCWCVDTPFTAPVIMLPTSKAGKEFGSNFPDMRWRS